MFGFAKRLIDCRLNENKNSHHPNYVSFSCPQITILAIELDIVEDVHIQQPPFGSINLLPLVFQDGLELKENICVDG